MRQFYVGLIFLGILIIIFILLLVLLDRKKAFNFVQNYEKKKQELVEVIYDAEQMIEELNKFSDYVVTQMDFKNEELSMNLKKAQMEIRVLAQKSQSGCRLSDEAVTAHAAVINKGLNSEINMEAKQEIAASSNHNTAAKPSEPLFKLNSDMEIENLNFDKNSMSGVIGYKPPVVKPDKGLPINGKYSEVLRLSKCGMSELDIARQLKMGKGEVQLILELNK